MVAMAGLYEQIRVIEGPSKLPYKPYLAFVRAYDRGNLTYDSEWLTQKFSLTAESQAETADLQAYIATLPNLSGAQLYVQAGGLITMPLVAQQWTTIPWTGRKVKYPWITSADDPAIPAGALVVDSSVVDPAEVLPINVKGQMTCVSSVPQEIRMRIYENDIQQAEIAGANGIDSSVPSQLTLPDLGFSARSGETIDMRVRAGEDTTLTISWGSLQAEFRGRYDQVLTSYMDDVSNAMVLAEWDQDYTEADFYDVLNIAPASTP